MCMCGGCAISQLQMSGPVMTMVSPSMGNLVTTLPSLPPAHSPGGRCHQHLYIPQQCGHVWKRLEVVMQWFEWTYSVRVDPNTLRPHNTLITVRMTMLMEPCVEQWPPWGNTQSSPHPYPSIQHTNKTSMTKMGIMNCVCTSITQPTIYHATCGTMYVELHPSTMSLTHVTLCVYFSMTHLSSSILYSL